MVKVIENFLTLEECLYYISMIDKNHTRSGVTSHGRERTTTSDYRTSSTCSFPIKDEKVVQLKERISKIVDLPIENGESLQGQLYKPGEYFKEHTDYFDPGSYENHCLSSGQRLKTLMIYLNEDVEGGGTHFKRLNKTFYPTTGTALLWDNVIDGKTNPDSLHEGMPVNSGSKYIITSWWRENEWNGAEDARLAMEYHKNLIEQEQMTQVKTTTFSTKEELPKISELGYKVIKTPEKAWNLIQEGYQLLKSNIKTESWTGIESIISGSQEPTEIMTFDSFPSLRDTILEHLKPVHEEWAKMNLTPAALYGIRSYNKGATLISHVDRIQTHHVSSIIIVDKDLDCGCNQTKGAENDWPLDFIDHNGESHKLYAEIGDMIMYESATCYHGRLEPFKGNYYRNLFAHFKFTDLEFGA